MRVRVEDKRKSRLLKFSDVVSVKPPGNNFGGLWTTWWDCTTWTEENYFYDILLFRK